MKEAYKLLVFATMFYICGGFLVGIVVWHFPYSSDWHDFPISQCADSQHKHCLYNFDDWFYPPVKYPVIPVMANFKSIIIGSTTCTTAVPDYAIDITDDKTNKIYHIKCDYLPE